MEEIRLKVNEELADTLAARVDDLERRLVALVALLGRESVCQALGLKDFEFHHTKANTMTLQLGPMKYHNQRHRTIEDRRQKEVLSRLSSVSPERLDDLLRSR